MNAPASPRTLADTGGLVVTDDGRRVLVFDRCTGALTVLAFVLGVVAVTSAVSVQSRSSPASPHRLWARCSWPSASPSRQ